MVFADATGNHIESDYKWIIQVYYYYIQYTSNFWFVRPCSLLLDDESESQDPEHVQSSQQEVPMETHEEVTKPVQDVSGQETTEETEMETNQVWRSVLQALLGLFSKRENHIETST